MSNVKRQWLTKKVAIANEVKPSIIHKLVPFTSHKEIRQIIVDIALPFRATLQPGL